MQTVFYDGVYENGYVDGMYVGRHTMFADHVMGEIWFEVMPENAEYTAKHASVETAPSAEDEVVEDVFATLYNMHNAEKSARFERRAEARKHKSAEMPQARKEQRKMRERHIWEKIPGWDYGRLGIRQERALSRDRSAMRDFRDEMAEDNKLARLMAEYEEKKRKYDEDSKYVNEAIQMVRVLYGDDVLRLMRDSAYDADREFELWDLETRLEMAGVEVK